MQLITLCLRLVLFSAVMQTVSADDPQHAENHRDASQEHQQLLVGPRVSPVPYVLEKRNSAVVAPRREASRMLQSNQEPIQPSSNSVSVLLKFQLDYFPQETGWRIENTDGDVAYSKPFGTYGIQGAVIEELLTLEDHREYVFYITDRAGDGIECDAGDIGKVGEFRLYRGIVENENQILTRHSSYSSFDFEWSTTFRTDEFLLFPKNHFPTAAPSKTNPPSLLPSMSISPTVTSRPSAFFVNVLLKLSLDRFPAETGWRIESTDGDVVYNRRNGTYGDGNYFTDPRGGVIEELLILEEAREYVFYLTDSRGDGLGCYGICEGCCFHSDLRLYRGVVENRDHVLAGYSDTSSSFQLEWRTTFRTDAFLPPTRFPLVFLTAPSMTSPPSDTSVNILLKFSPDVNFYYTGWRIESMNGDIVYNTPPGTYHFSSRRPVIEELLTLEDNREYVLYLTNSRGDGFGGDISDSNDDLFHGELRLYRGVVENQDQIVAGYSDMTSSFQFEWSTTFRADEFLAATAFSLLFPTNAPSSIPSDSPAPSLTRHPSVSPIQFLLKFTLYSSPSRTGWRIKRGVRDIVYSKLPGTYADESVNLVIEEPLILEDHTEYQLEVINKFYGLVREFDVGEFRLYRGDVENQDQILASVSFIKSSFGFESGTARSIAFSTDEFLPGAGFSRVFPTVAPSMTSRPSILQPVQPTQPAQPMQSNKPVHPVPPPIPTMPPAALTPPPAPSVPLAEPVWWPRVSANFVGTNLRLCKKRKGAPPLEGMACQKEPKTCFFGVQQCPNGVGAHPVTRCFCDGQHGDRVWTCGEAECPTQVTDPIE